jgi:predicted membrane protein
MQIDTKVVMSLCAVMLGIWGVLLSFLPQELATVLGWAEANFIILQILGALYFSFAMINWTAKANIIGGIYGRPIAIGNFTHFVIGALALLKWVMNNPVDIIWIAITILYGLFAMLFGMILFTHPRLKSKEKVSSIS